MASIYKRGNKLWLKYYIHGKEYRESLGLTDTRENRVIARKLRKQKEVDILNGIHPTIRKLTKKKLSNSYKEFIRTREKEKRSQATIDLYEYAHEKFLKFAGDIELKNVNEWLIEQFEREVVYSEQKDENGNRKKLSDNSIELIFRHLRIIFDYYLSKNYIEKNPFPKKSKIPKKVKVVSAEETDKILELLKAQSLDQYRAIKLLLMTGLRISELIRMEFEDIDYKRKLLYVKNHKGKRVDALPIYEKLELFLTSEFPNKSGKVVPYTNRGSFRFLKRLLQKNGFEHYTIHELRKTFISRLVNSGKFSIFEIQKLARHKDIRTTQRSYIELEMRRIGETINDVI